MEEVKAEHPHFAAGAIHQMAVERFATMNEARSLSHRGDNDGNQKKGEPKFLQDMMQKLRIGMSQKKTGGMMDESETTSTTVSDEHGEPRRLQRSLAPRKSITIEEIAEERSRRNSTEVNEVSGDVSVSSLEKALANIELGVDHLKFSQRFSAISFDLADLKEDAKYEDDHVLDNEQPKVIEVAVDFNNDKVVEHEHKSLSRNGKVQSVSDFLPDELNEVLKSSRFLPKQQSNRSSFSSVKSSFSSCKKRPSFRRRSGDTSQRSVSSRMMHDSTSSLMSAFDEDKAFEGDFSGWRHRSISSCNS